MPKLVDLTGMRFGRLTVVERAGNKGKKAAWLCVCDCGNTLITTGENLRCGDTQSCGCYNRERSSVTNTKHGHSRSKLYAIHQSMKARCYNPNNKQYKDYGDRGIKVCDEWLNNFEVFYKWAMANGYEEHLTVDRIDNNGNYCPENCRWTTMKQQSNNRRNNNYITYNGETHTLSEWARITKQDRGALNSRINKYHWSIEKALFHPHKKRTKKSAT